MTAQSTTGERLARLESAYEHLATKADVERLRADVKADIAALRGWIIGAAAVVGAFTTTAAIIARLAF